MAILDSIQQAKQQGASDDAILAEVLRQNPSKASVFQQAKNKGADSATILNEIIKQNSSTTGQPQVQKPSFGDSIIQGTKNIGADIAGTKQNTSQGFIPSIIQNTLGSKGLAGIAQLPGRVAGAISEYAPVIGQHQGEKLNEQAAQMYNQAADILVQARSVQDPVQQNKLREQAKQLMSSADQLKGSAENIGQYTDTTGGQALGTTINAGLTAATGAKPNLLGTSSKILKAGENAAVGAGYQLGSNLSNKEKVTEGLGTAALFGGVLPAALTGLSSGAKAIGNKINPLSEGIINSLIKPLQKDFAYGKNPAQGILREGIIANDIEGLGTQVNNHLKSIGEGIGQVGDQITNAGVKLDLSPAIGSIDRAMNQAAKLNNESLVKSLYNVKIALTHDLGLKVNEAGTPSIVKSNLKNINEVDYNQAVKFLSDIVEHTRFTGNPSDDKLLNSATKEAYQITREIMNKTAGKVDPQLEVTIRDLNSRYADLNSAKSAIAHRELVAKKNNILTLSDKFAIPVAVGTALLTGDLQKAGLVLVTQLGGAAALRAAGSTAAKTRVANFLTKIAPEERQGILNSTPVLKAWYERLTGNKSPGETAPKTASLKTAEAIGNVAKQAADSKGGFVKIGGQRIHSDDLAVMSDFTDYVAKEYKPGPKLAHELEIDAARIAEKLGLKNFKSTKGLANEFGRILEKANFKGREKVIKSSIEKTDKTLDSSISEYLNSI